MEIGRIFMNCLKKTQSQSKIIYTAKYIQMLETNVFHCIDHYKKAKLYSLSWEEMAANGNLDFLRKPKCIRNGKYVGKYK